MTTISLPQIKYAGRFKIIKRIGDKITYESNWQNNLITNAGLNYFGTDDHSINVMDYLHLSSNNNEPTVNDVQILNAERVARGSRIENNFQYTDNEPYYTETVYKYIFNPTSPRRAFNAAKLHLSPSNDTNDQVFSSALVKDSNGNPTTLSIREEETLEVIYGLRQYFDLTVSTSTMVLEIDRGEGVVEEIYDVKSSIYLPGRTDPLASEVGNGWDGTTSELRAYILPFGNSRYSRTYGFNVSPDSMPPNPLTTRMTNIDASDGNWTPDTAVGEKAYIADSFKKEIIVKLYRGYGNHDTGIRTISIATSKGVFILEYTSQSTGQGIPKTSYDELTLNFEMSWGRR